MRECKRFVSNKFFIRILVAIAVIFGAVLLNDRKSNQSGSNDSGSSQSASQHMQGSDKTGVVLIEYGDFECQHCWRAESVVQAVREKYKDQINSNSVTSRSTRYTPTPLRLTV